MNETINKRHIEKFRIDKLKDKETKERYQYYIREAIKYAPKPNLNNIEEMWNTFKHIITEATKRSCGIIGNAHNRKQTHWWNDKVKNAVKEKKQRWKKYLNTKKEQDYEDYKRQRKITKEEIKKSKERSWEEFGNKLEENFKENQKLFYRTLKSCKKGKQTTLKQLKDKQGKIIKEDKNIMERWKEHFEELLEGEHNNKNIIADNNEASSAGIKEDTWNITEEELKTVIKKLKNGKAAGHDRIKPEQLKYMGEEGEQILLVMLNKIWELKQIPKDWEKAVIFPIHKKGDSRICSNYRGISLLCTTGKIYEAILENKLRQEIETTIEQAQSGFRKGYSTQDHIFTIRRLIERTLRQDSKLYIAFLDLEKAFDKVPRKKVWKILKERNIGEQLIAAIKSIYNRTSNYIRTGNDISTEFITTQGLRQGGALSPMLFIIYMDDIMKNIKKKSKKMEIGHHKLTRLTISECVFADDIALLAKNEQDLQHNINLWNEELNTYNMTINIDKTKSMVIAKEETTTEIRINGKQLEQVETFTYLGHTLNNKGNMDNEINNRILAANKSYYAMNKIILKNKQVSKKTKITLYKTIYRPTLLYGSETWTTNNGIKNKIQTAEMKYLRRVEGVTRLDRIRNDRIREILQIEKIHKTIEKKQLAWYGHLERMSEDKQTKKVWNSRATKKGSRGRPQKTWEDNIEEILKRNNISREKARNTARNRKDWKELINTIE